MAGNGVRGTKRKRASGRTSATSTAAGEWFVYIVACSDGTLYAGVTTDANARVARHNAGAGAKYTRTRRPVELVYLEPANGRGAALTREHEIKRMSADAKRRLVAGATR